MFGLNKNCFIVFQIRFITFEIVSQHSNSF